MKMILVVAKKGESPKKAHGKEGTLAGVCINYVNEAPEGISLLCFCTKSELLFS